MCTKYLWYLYATSQQPDGGFTYWSNFFFVSVLKMTPSLEMMRSALSLTNRHVFDLSRPSSSMTSSTVFGFALLTTFCRRSRTTNSRLSGRLSDLLPFLCRTWYVPSGGSRKYFATRWWTEKGRRFALLSYRPIRRSPDL